MLGYPPDSTLKRYVKNGHIKNCNISKADIDRATNIYGISEPVLRSKMIAPSKASKKDI